ncbi:MAG: succinate dehydrogenase cytochrome b subunit [Bacteroidetes bacterium]|nr:succinate dehydrogenase cytochrome b subunit [Bacteroidota bacterium]
MAKENFFSSTIGKKLIVGLTGLFLISFLVIHVSVNSLILLNDGGETFNAAAHFMSHFWLIRLLEIGLLLGILLHIVLTLRLTIANRQNRPVKYVVSAANQNSKWYSRSMGVLGSLLLIFLVVHMSDFWWATKKALYITKEVDNPYTEIIATLSNPIFLVIYVIGVVSLGFHLLHGFPSAFQSLGLNHKKYTPIIKALGTAFSIVVPGLFAIIALCVFFGLVQ